MRITIDLPDDVANLLQSRSHDIERTLIEAVAIEGYRSGALTHAQVGRILGFTTPMQVDELLLKAKVFDVVSEAEIDRELDTGRRLISLRESEPRQR